jgi:trimethylamine--corrinoid protein Co-methyltransferase
VSVFSAKMIPFFIEACRIAAGSLEEVKKDPVFAVKCWINSPFMLTRENIDIAMEARRLLGIPVTFGQMPVAGGAGPVTVSGSLVQNTAESLAICAMRLAIENMVQPLKSTSAVIDMKHLSNRQSGPDMLLHIIAGSEMNAYLFGEKPGIPFLGISAQTVSPQSLYEKALSAAFNTAAGQMDLGVGSLAYSDIGSPVQLVLDYEMGLYFRHLLRDVSADREHAGLDTILETARRGAYYLETEHTVRFFREESWLPDFMDPRPPIAWMQNPTDMIDQARTRTKELYKKTENMCPLSEDKKQQLRALIKEADSSD